MQIVCQSLFMRGFRKFFQRGSNSDNVCFLFWGRRGVMRWDTIQIPLKAGHHRPTSETPFKWSHGSFVIFNGIRTSIAKKPYIFLIFQGGTDPLPHPSGSAHVFYVHQNADGDSLLSYNVKSAVIRTYLVDVNFCQKVTADPQVERSSSDKAYIFPSWHYKT